MLTKSLDRITEFTEEKTSKSKYFIRDSFMQRKLTTTILKKPSLGLEFDDQEKTELEEKPEKTNELKIFK